MTIISLLNYTSFSFILKIFCSCIYWANLGKPIAVQSNEELDFYYIEIGVKMGEIDA
jgi:hypothetical protein